MSPLQTDAWACLGQSGGCTCGCHVADAAGGVALSMTRPDAWVMLCSLELFLTVWSARDASAPAVERMRGLLVDALAPDGSDAATVLEAVRSDLVKIAQQVPRRVLEELWHA